MKKRKSDQSREGSTPKVPKEEQTTTQTTTPEAETGTPAAPTGSPKNLSVDMDEEAKVDEQKASSQQEDSFTTVIVRTALGHRKFEMPTTELQYIHTKVHHSEDPSWSLYANPGRLGLFIVNENAAGAAAPLAPPWLVHAAAGAMTASGFSNDVAAYIATGGAGRVGHTITQDDPAQTANCGQLATLVSVDPYVQHCMVGVGGPLFEVVIGTRGAARGAGVDLVLWAPVAAGANPVF